VDGDLFRHYAQATREAFATGINCPVSAFEGDRLTIVDRHADADWYTILAVTFGTGTVVSIDPAYHAFAEANQPEKPSFAMRRAFLQQIVEEGARRGEKLAFSVPSLCFALADEPPELAPPPGLVFTREDAAWMNDAENGRRFENGAGGSGSGREFRNRFALVLRDTAGEIAAVAGALETHGMLEIGVDVVREHRGLGLGRLAVSAVARAIIDEGKVPFYACSPTNIRSQRTAAASGFRIVCADAFVWIEG
jgi:GNAT superfamily N-acetyltransferase